MKKIAIASLFAGLFAFVLIGCKGKDANMDPKAVVTAFFEKMAQKDVDGAAKYCTKDSKSTLDMMKKGIEMAEKMKGSDSSSVKEEDDFKDMVVGDAKIDGESATVSVTNTKKKETVDFPLKKEGGAWKVDFTMGTLMKMGMDANKDKGEDLFKDESAGGDTTNMEDLNNILNSDSLKQQMEKLKDELKEVIKDKE